MPIPPGTLKAEYDFQNGSYPGSGTTVFDLSGTGNTLAITSGGTWVSGTPNYFNLAGNTAIYKSPALGGIANTNVFTMNLWYYKLTEDDDGIVNYLGKDFPNEGATFGNTPGNGFAVSGGFGYGIINVSGIAIPGWNFISYVSTGSSTTAYLNGASVGSTTNVPSIPADGGICLGTGLNNASPPVPRLDLAGIGRVGYFDIYNVALGSTEITDIYNATVSSYIPPPPAPIAEYDFQNGSYPGSGTTVFDLSGTGNTLAISAGGTWVSGTPNYFDLNGDTAIFKSPAIGGIASTNVYTLNSWYYLPTSVNNSVIFDVGSDAPNTQAHFGSGFSLGTLYGTGGFGLGVLELTGAAQPGWNFISYVSTGSSTTAYLNGASVGSTTNVPALGANTGICLGTNLNSANPTQPRLDLAAVGRIGYASVYNVALGSTEITDIYNATSGSYPPVPGPSSNGVGGRQFAQGFNG